MLRRSAWVSGQFLDEVVFGMLVEEFGMLVEEWSPLTGHEGP